MESYEAEPLRSMVINEFVANSDATVEDYVESIHSRNGFSRDRMGAERAATFDDLVRRTVAPHARDGRLRWPVTALVRWGR